MRYAVGRWAEGRWEQKRRSFLVAGTNTATLAAANECTCNLWNPSSTRSLWVAEFSWQRNGSQGAIDPLRLCRTSTAGTTPSSTVTPDLDNDVEREIAPNTGAVLYLGNFTTEPTLLTPELYRLAFPTGGLVHSMTWLFREGIRVPPGTGLALATTATVSATTADHVFRFWE